MVSVRGMILNKGLQQKLLSRIQVGKVLSHSSSNHINNANFRRIYPRFFTSPTSFTVSCDDQPSQFKTLASSQTDFTLNITKHVFLKEKYNNMNAVFSPLSLHVALSMVAAGSQKATLNEFLTFLRAKSTDHLNFLASHLASVVLRDAAPAGGPRLCFSNGVWVEQTLPLEPSFKQLVANDYKATFSFVDFKMKHDEVAEEINLWAEEKTMGLIKNILPPNSLSNVTKLIFANAVYFKGVWNQKFNASMTKDCDFQLLNETSVKVPFMTSNKDQFIGVFDGFKVLRLPYNQGNNDKRQFSMYIFLPDANDGLLTLVEQVASESRFLECHFPHQKVKVCDFKIPKFKISWGLDISDVAREIGLVLPFDKDYADLTKIVKPLISKDNLYVSNIFQKSFIEVNEEGTEAAAVTGIKLARTSLDHTFSNRIDFVADHPFLFLIREDLSGTILFSGRVLDPLKS